MENPQQLAQLVFGVLIAFAGYSMFRSMLPLWGFILGGWLAYTFSLGSLVSIAAFPGAAQWAAIVVCGAAGALLARPLYYLTVFLTGAVLGGVVGVMIGAVMNVGGLTSLRQIQALIDLAFPPIPQTGSQYLLMIILGILAGGLAIMFQRFMLIASTAFLGAALFITGFGPVLSSWAVTAAGRAVVMVVGWIVLGILSMFVQSHLTEN